MKRFHSVSINNRSGRLILLAALLLTLTSASFAQQKKKAEQAPLYFPPYGSWEQREPEKMGFDTTELNNAIKFAIENEIDYPVDLRIAILNTYGREPGFRIMGPVIDRGEPSGVIVRNGYIVASWGDIERPEITFSATKSYLSTVAGLAYDYGLIEVEDKVWKNVTDGTFNGPHNSKITWEHLLNQSSDWSGTLFGVPDWADRPPRTGTPDDWQRRELLEPGTAYEYNDVRVNLLAYSLLQVYRRPLPVILKERIMDPIGASTTWRWNGYDNSWITIDGQMIQSVSGGAHFGGGMIISTLDHARFGLLFLRNGEWNGKRLVSEEWIRKATSPSPANSSYGYMWWLLTGSTKWKGVPDSVFYAVGMGGNYVIVDQPNDMVVVVRWINPSKIGEMMTMIVKSQK
ncbi:MAG: beta-lactamase family protein [Bacteroidales bacterium]|nr:beta-lactamase family protein [Bacteroidales bacterium]